MQPILRSSTLLAFSAAMLSAQAALGAPPKSDVAPELDAAFSRLAIDQTAEFSDVEIEAGRETLWNFPLLTAAQLHVGDPLVFILPGGRSIELPLADRTLLTQGCIGFAFTDTVQGASAEVVVHDGLVHGRFRGLVGGRFERWEFESNAANGALRFRVPGQEAPCVGVTGDENEPKGAGDAAAGDGAGGSDGGVAGGCTDNGSLIDVLFAYTPAFAASFASTSAFEAAVLLDLTTANAALANSRVAMRYRAAGFFALTQNGTGNLGDDLTAIIAVDDGRWDNVHEARNDARADLVTLLSDTGGGGIATLGVGNPASGFCAVGSTGGFLLAHELGHNLGCCHAFNDGGGCDNSGGYFSYSLGKRFTAGASGTVYRTVMAYSPGEQIPFFSNPQVTYLGTPTGSFGTNPATAADNARTIALTSSVVASYRCSASDFTDCDDDGVSDAQAIADGLVPDCNFTGIPDECDIALGISLDTDNDGVPDECPLGDLEITTLGFTPLDTLGSAVGVSSKTGDPEILLVLGAPGNDTGASNAGVAYAVRIQAGATVGFSPLRAPTPRANAFFGRGVAAYKRPASPTGSPATFPARNFALVGAYREDSIEAAGTYVSKGALYLFAQNGSTWTQVWRLTPPPSYSTFDYSLFGYSVAMGRNPRESGDQIIVGSPGFNGGKGRVFIARNYITPASVERGGFQSSRDLPAATEGDNFGASVALEPALQLSTSATAMRVIAVAGAPGRDDARGAAYVFDRTAFYAPNGGLTSFPTVPIVLTPPATGGTSAPGDRFGTSVAISGPLIAIGAPGADDGRGIVHFWERRIDTPAASLTNYLYRGSFKDPEALPGDGLGTALSIAPDVTGTGYTIVASAPKSTIETPTGPKPRAGKVYVLHKVLGTSPATLDAVRIENSPATGDEFGYSAASTRGYSIIGIPFNDLRGLNAGKARLMTVP